MQVERNMVVALIAAATMLPLGCGPVDVDSALALPPDVSTHEDFLAAETRDVDLLDPDGNPHRARIYFNSSATETVDKFVEAAAAVPAGAGTGSGPSS